jgi:SAM-dependent methyltransferase
MKTLNEIGLNYNSDKVSEHHNYLNLYDKFFTDIRFNENKILEIGVLHGDSIKMLKDYFENSTITGIDIDNKEHLSSDRLIFLQNDQSNRNFLEGFEDDSFDVIIDDGSHKMSHQQISFGVLFKKLKKGGVYIIEDLHTSLPEYFETVVHGIGLFGLNEDNSNSTIKFLETITSGNPSSQYLTEEELKYIKENVSSAEIHITKDKEKDRQSITSIILKNE